MSLPLQQTRIGCSLRGAEHQALRLSGTSVGVEVMRARFPPGSRILRLPRFGRGRTAPEVEEAIRGLRGLAESSPVVRAAQACREQGFERVPTPRMYSRTLWIRIAADEEAILAGFHPTARRHIRAPNKKGYVVVALTEDRLAARLEELHQASFTHSGGEAPFVDWSATLAAARRHPDRVAIRAVIPAGRPAEEALSFAVAVRNDDVAEYLHAGSLRRPEARIPLLYAPTWALMRWARSHGARAWDFGGITDGTAHDDDPRGGISDFKRYFGGEVREVGEEWVYEPGGVAAGLARAANRVKTRILDPGLPL